MLIHGIARPCLPGLPWRSDYALPAFQPVRRICLSVDGAGSAAGDTRDAVRACVSAPAPSQSPLPPNRVDLPAELPLRDLIRILPGYNPYDQAGDCTFDEARAANVIRFIERFCHHVKGALGGQLLKLEPWQKAVFANLYGWRRPDGTRRYREALVYIPRGNSKTTMGAAIVFIHLFTDREAGAELYSAAAERDQARLCFDVVTGMIRSSPEWRGDADLFKYSIVVRDKSYKALSAEAGSKHGFSPQLVVNDELHAHRTPELTNVLATGTLKRAQPLVIHLTTADYEREGSVCNDKHDYACRVRDNHGDPLQPGYDPAFLPVIYEATKEDDWTDPCVWRKANPNYEVSVPHDYLARECRRAKEDPSYENTFKRLHLDIRTEQADRLLPVERWDACLGELPDLTGQRCWCGLDLGATRDFTAFVAVFRVGERFAVKSIFWIPQSAAGRRRDQMGATFLAWERARVLRVTPGDEVDYERVEMDLVEFSKDHAVQEIAADRLFQGAQLIQHLNEKHGLLTFQHGQGYLDMAVPTRTFLEHVGAGKILHDGNPIMRWMVTNLTGKQDEAGNWKPDKKRSAEKIDGVVALIMALGRATVAQPQRRSFYEEHPELECV